MTNEKGQLAVIYCRVSDSKQTVRGSGLDSQETRCREYAKYKGYKVAEVFKDDFTGAASKRPSMTEMLAYLRKRRAESFVVIIDDISRLARGLRAHLQLRTDIAAVGARLESPTVEFGEDSDSQLVENMLASVSQHHRQKNAEQTKNRMRARAQNGYWVFWPPFGYRFERSPGQGKVLVRNEPLASTVTEALEGYASGRFDTQAEVRRFLEARPEFPRDSNGEIRNQRITDLLTQPLYAGYIDLPDWGINLVQGRHEALISFQTFRRIQDRLTGKAKVPARKDTREDFPLRGFILCGDCSTPLTAGWSKGRSCSYPYYLCPSRGCPSYGKSIKRDQIEGEFETLLGKLRPAPGLFEFAYKMLRELWEGRCKDAKRLAASMQGELRAIERKVEQLMDRVVDADSDTLVTAYEARIRKLAMEKIELAERVKGSATPHRNFDETLRTALGFLANPCLLWTPGASIAAERC